VPKKQPSFLRLWRFVDRQPEPRLPDSFPIGSRKSLVFSASSLQPCVRFLNDSVRFFFRHVGERKTSQLDRMSVVILGTGNAKLAMTAPPNGHTHDACGKSDHD
jgi:hypothetical protein